MSKHGKKYRDMMKKIDRTKTYGAIEAVDLLKATRFVKFDETVEVAVNLGVNPRHVD